MSKNVTKCYTFLTSRGNITGHPLSILCYLLSNCGLMHAWLNQGVGNETLFLKTFEQRLKDIFLQDWHTRIAENSKLQLYNYFKNDFCFGNLS